MIRTECMSELLKEKMHLWIQGFHTRQAGEKADVVPHGSHLRALGVHYKQIVVPHTYPHPSSSTYQYFTFDFHLSLKNEKKMFWDWERIFWSERSHQTFDTYICKSQSFFHPEDSYLYPIFPSFFVCSSIISFYSKFSSFSLSLIFPQALLAEYPRPCLENFMADIQKMSWF